MAVNLGPLSKVPGPQVAINQRAMYSCVQGFLREVPGSWMPDSGTGAHHFAEHLQCRNALCVILWRDTWPRMYRDGSAWEEMKSLECSLCSAERRRRCRVAELSTERQQELSTVSADAVYIHPFNAPKSKISIL